VDSAVVMKATLSARSGALKPTSVVAHVHSKTCAPRRRYFSFLVSSQQVDRTRLPGSDAITPTPAEDTTCSLCYDGVMEHPTPQDTWAPLSLLTPEQRLSSAGP
jgi:hypothetical protein